MDYLIRVHRLLNGFQEKVYGADVTTSLIFFSLPLPFEIIKKNLNNAPKFFFF